jgi:hypothetical protein
MNNAQKVSNSGFLLAGALFLSVFVTSCSNAKESLGTQNADEKSSPGGGNGDDAQPNLSPVSITFEIDKAQFSPSVLLSISVKSAADIKIDENNRRCSFGYDVATKKESRFCPSGVDYIEPKIPWSISIPAAELKESITVLPDNIRVGEEYNLQVSGKSNDDCNHASGGHQGIAESAKLSLGKLSFASTQMACANKN